MSKSKGFQSLYKQSESQSTNSSTSSDYTTTYNTKKEVTYTYSIATRILEITTPEWVLEVYCDSKRDTLDVVSIVREMRKDGFSWQAIKQALALAEFKNMGVSL